MSLAPVVFATASWVDWYNNRRTHGSLGMLARKPDFAKFPQKPRDDSVVPRFIQTKYPRQKSAFPFAYDIHIGSRLGTKEDLNP